MEYAISLNERLSAGLFLLSQAARNLPCGEAPSRAFSPSDGAWMDHMRSQVGPRDDFDRIWRQVMSQIQDDSGIYLRNELTRGLYRWVRQDPGNAPGQILVINCENNPTGFANFLEELLDEEKLARRHRYVAFMTNSFVNPCYARTLDEIHDGISRQFADDPEAREALMEELETNPDA